MSFRQLLLPLSKTKLNYESWINPHKTTGWAISYNNRVQMSQIEEMLGRFSAISQQCNTVCLHIDCRLCGHGTRHVAATERCVHKTHSELVSCATSDPLVRQSINCSPAARRATDYLLAGGEKFHAVLARVITPIRGVVICVSAATCSIKARCIATESQDDASLLPPSVMRLVCSRPCVRVIRLFMRVAIAFNRPFTTLLSSSSS